MEVEESERKVHRRMEEPQELLDWKQKEKQDVSMKEWKIVSGNYYRIQQEEKKKTMEITQQRRNRKKRRGGNQDERRQGKQMKKKESSGTLGISKEGYSRKVQKDE